MMMQHSILYMTFPLFLQVFSYKEMKSTPCLTQQSVTSSVDETDMFNQTPSQLLLESSHMLQLLREGFSYT